MAQVRREEDAAAPARAKSRGVDREFSKLAARDSEQMRINTRPKTSILDLRATGRRGRLRSRHGVTVSNSRQQRARKSNEKDRRRAFNSHLIDRCRHSNVALLSPCLFSYLKLSLKLKVSKTVGPMETVRGIGSALTMPVRERN